MKSPIRTGHASQHTGMGTARKPLSVIMLLGLLAGILVPLGSAAAASPRHHVAVKHATSSHPKAWPTPVGGWAKSINPAPSPLRVTRRGTAWARPSSRPRAAWRASPLTTCTIPGVPTSLTTGNLSSYDPYLTGTVNCNGSGGLWAYFNVEDSNGNVIYSAESSGTIGMGLNAQTQIPTGDVRPGDSYSWYMYDCLNENNTSCSADTANQPFIVDPLLNAGDDQTATYESFPAGDELNVRVNVNSGDLEIKQNDISLAGILSPVVIGQVYNSLDLAPGSSNASGLDLSPGWGLSVPGSVQLQNDNGPVALYDSTGRVWLFTGNASAACGVNYVSPGGIDATLTPVCSGSTITGYNLAFNKTNDTQYFRLTTPGNSASTAVLYSDADRDSNKVYYNPVTSSSTQLASINGTRGTASTVNFTPTSGSPLTSISQGTTSPYIRSATLGYTSGNLTSVLDPAGNTTHFSYTGGLLTQLTEPNGNIITFGYDSHDRVTTVTQDPTGTDAVTTFGYTDGVNGNTVMTDALGRKWTYLTDYANRVQTELDPGNNVVYGSSYNEDAKPLTLSNGIGTSSYTYNDAAPSLGENLMSSTDGSGAITSFQYNGGSKFLVSQSTDPAGNITMYNYSPTFDPSSTENQGLVISASVDYNMNGTAKDSEDPAGNKTTYSYDSGQTLNLITPQTKVSPPSDPLNPTTVTNDPFGRISTVKDGNGVTKTLTYDGLDRVTEVQYSDSTPTVTYTYDGDGYLKIRVAGGVTVNYGYNTLNQETSDVITSGASLSYGYDAVGDMTSLTDARGTTTYHYNADEELSYMVEGSSGNTDVFAYDSAHRRTDTWDDTGGSTLIPPAAFAMHSHLNYNGAGHVTSIVMSRASNDATQFENLSYCYVAIPSPTYSCSGGKTTDNVYRVTNNLTNPPTTTSYTYDQGERVTSAGINNGGATYNYSYTTNSNISNFNSTTYDYSANPWNEVDNTGWTYDYDGNLTADPVLGSLTYNGASQTTSVGGTSVSYATEGEQEVTAIGTTSFVNGLEGIQSTTQAGVTKYFERTPDGQLISEVTPTENYYATDYEGSVIALVGPAGTLNGTYTYDPYGNVTNTLTTPAMNNPWRFTGGYWAAGVNLYHFGARWYDPSVGRWTQPDSVVTLNDPTNGNLYAYVKDNPVNNSDPSGRCGISWTFEISDCGVLNTALNYFNNAFTSGVDDAAAGAAAGCVAGEAFGTIGCPAGYVGGGVTGFVGGFVGSVANDITNW